MLADCKHDLAAAIDDHGRAAPLEPRTDGDLDHRNGEQHNEKHDHGSHMILPAPDLHAEVIINATEKFGSGEPYKNVFRRKMDRKTGSCWSSKYLLSKTLAWIVAPHPG
jgi:hypothetical protein